LLYLTYYRYIINITLEDIEWIKEICYIVERIFPFGQTPLMLLRRRIIFSRKEMDECLKP